MNLPRRILGATLGGAAVLAVAIACGRQRSAGPDWVASAPAGSVVALSGKAGWLLEQRSFQAYLANFPYADQTLDLFLKKARINPHLESGRINFYVMNFSAAGAPPDFLIQLGGFRDQRAVQMAIADAFPAEGSLPVRKKELPVYVILDVNQYHIRAVADPAGRIWLGDLRSLAKLDAGAFPPRHPVPEAAAWINASAPFQGFIQTRIILDGLSGNVPPELARNLPQGIDALAWSVTPGQPGKNGLHRFELAITGSPEGVVQVAPWVQRFVAAASTLQGGQPGQAPEILQERKRIGLRCQLTGEQINQALGRLSQPALADLVHRP